MKTLQLLFTFIFLSVSTLLFSQEFAVYVSDAANFNSGPFKIIQYNSSGNNPLTIVEDNLAWPQDIVFLEDQGVMLISSLISGTITKHNAATGAYIEDFATGINGPTRMKIGPDGLLYVLQWQNTSPVLRYTLNGDFVDEFTTAGINNAIGLDWDTDGNLYVSSFNNATVKKFGTDGSDLGTFISTGLTGPTNIAFLENGELMVLDWSGGNISKFDSDGNSLGVFIDGLSQPEGIAFYPNGDFLIGNGGEAEIKKYSSDGMLIGNLVESGSGGLLQPNAVILRDAALSVSEKKIDNVFLTPTIGNMFRFNQKALLNFDLLQIFNANGKLIDTLYPKKETNWNAEGISEGLYFVVGKHKGEKVSQKIIIKN